MAPTLPVSLLAAPPIGGAAAPLSLASARLRSTAAAEESALIAVDGEAGLFTWAQTARTDALSTPQQEGGSGAVVTRGSISTGGLKLDHFMFRSHRHRFVKH